MELMKADEKLVSESLSVPSVPWLTSLPDLIWEKLLTYLDDLRYLKTLRLVCKTTKSWVEQPPLLKLFPVVINSEDRMRDVQFSKVKWNHFIFCKNYPADNRERIKWFIKKFSWSARILKFKWPQDKIDHEVKILLQCPDLERVETSQLDFSHLSSTALETLRQNWQKIRHLHIRHFMKSSDGPLVEMQFFEKLLSSCSQLETLTLPQFSYEYEPSKSLVYSDIKQILRTHVLSPVVRYLDRIPLKSITVPYFGLTEDLFLELAEACLNTNTVLFNVRIWHLQNLSREKENIFNIIGSLDGITDSIVRSPLPNLESVSFVNPSFHIVDSNYKFPPIPKLKSVEIDFNISRECPKSLELFLHRLGKLKRESVTSLEIIYHSGPPAISPLSIGIVDLASSFTNLRKLHVKDYEGDDSQFILLWKLVPNLLDLSLVNCRYLTDLGILGHDPDSPAMLNLKYIKKLAIINYFYSEKPSITELSFIYAFRYMRLKVFHFYDVTPDGICYRENPPLASAFNALWTGPFAETIEDYIFQEVGGQGHGIFANGINVVWGRPGCRQMKIHRSLTFRRRSNKRCDIL